MISQLQHEAKSGSNYKSTDSKDTMRSICFQEFIPNICTTKQICLDMASKFLPQSSENFSEKTGE